MNYIWISHEHPDHLSFQTLQSIPAKDRGRIVVLYQKHSSPRIAAALERLNFNRVMELPLYRWTALSQGVDVLCGSVGSMDSFLAIRGDGECVLNLNDCVLNAALVRVRPRLGLEYAGSVRDVSRPAPYRRPAVRALHERDVH